MTLEWHQQLTIYGTIIQIRERLVPYKQAQADTSNMVISPTQRISQGGAEERDIPLIPKQMYDVKNIQEGSIGDHHHERQ